MERRVYIGRRQELIKLEGRGLYRWKAGVDTSGRQGLKHVEGRG